jgi:Na+-transporting NADH:ubiquinone oxidoreductase subunit A
MLVDVDDVVVPGQPLFIDKRDPKVMYTAPGSGRVVAIHRGSRRRLLAVVVELDDSATSSSFETPLTGDLVELTRQQIVEQLCRSGLWSSLRTRPFGKVPLANSHARSIFVTAMDSNPLAGDTNAAIDGREDAFAAGLDVLGKLTDGSVHLCTGPDWRGPLGDGNKVRHTVFEGPHPAGLVGTHIHHLDPVAANRTVWHINHQDVAAVGRLFADGLLDFSRRISLGGPSVRDPRLVQSRLGADIGELTDGELLQQKSDDGKPRLISGPVLSGRWARDSEAYLGRYHWQVAALPEEKGERLFGWLGFRRRGHTFAGMFKRRRPRTNSAMSTASGGLPSTLIAVDAFEDLMPLDILPVPLLRALMIQDTDQAQALGCLELDAEDLALCSYVCPGKVDYGRILRVNLEKIEREG